MARHRNNIWVALLLTVSSGAVFYGVWSMSGLGRASSQVDQELRRLKELGLVTSASELRVRIALPGAKNAAPLYDRAYELIRKVRPSDRSTVFNAYRSTLTDGDIPDSLEASARTAIVQYEPAFQCLSTACRYPYVDYHRNWERGTLVIFPDLAYGSTAARALLLKARLEELDNRPFDALKHIDIVVRMTAGIMHEPISLSKYMASFMQERVWKELGRILCKFGTQRLVLQECRQVLNNMTPIQDVRKVIGGEVVAVRATAEGLSNTELRRLLESPITDPFGHPVKVPLSMRMSSYKVVRDAYEAYALRFWREVAESLPTNLEDSEGIALAFRTAFKKRESDKRWEGDLFRAMFVGMKDMGELSATTRARKNLLLTAIDLLVEHISSHEFPKHFEFHSKNAIDPFTNKPFGYLAFPDGFLIYSFGPNGIDDGGDPVGASWTTLPTDDIPFQYP